MRVDNLFYYFIGFSIGPIIKVLLTMGPGEPHRHDSRVYQSSTDIASVRRIRILCYIPTSTERQKRHNRKDVHVHETWGKHCDRLVFGSTVTDNYLGVIGFNVTDDFRHLWDKTKHLLQYVYRNFIDDYDWFYKADDNTFAIIENIRFLVSAYSPNDPIHFGYRHYSKRHEERAFFFGGPGYVLSNKAVRMFCEKYPTTNTSCPGERPGGGEDWNLGHCMHSLSILAGDSRDLLKRKRFFHRVPKNHLFPNYELWKWYFDEQIYKDYEGLNCCSNYTISYHTITSAKYIYALYYMAYRLRAYGIKHRFPPPPRKLDFGRVKFDMKCQRFHRRN